MGRPENMVELYVLRDPVTGAIRYAGKANNAEKRLKSHLRDCKRRKTPVYCWMAAHVIAGRVPTIEVVERVQGSEWPSAERVLIARLRAEGAQLLNLAEGGDQPFTTLAQLQANARRLVQIRRESPEKSRLWEMKRALSVYVKTAPKTERYYALVAKMRMCAQKRPDLFGQWAML